MTAAAPLLAAAAVVLAAPSPMEDFERGRNAFARGEYRRVIDVLRPLLYPAHRLESEAQVVQAYRMLGVAHLFEKESDAAEREFRKLLELRPDFRFDPLLDPPPVVEFFNAVLRGQAEELARLEARRKRATDRAAARRQAEEAERQRNMQRVVIERRFERRSFAVNFIPFGAGQFQNGHRGKGWAFLISESVLGLTSVGTFAANFIVFGFTQQRPCKLRQPPEGRCPLDQIDTAPQNTSSILSGVSLVTGGLFWAVTTWGVVDAIRHYRREVPLTPEVDPRPSARAALRLRPVWTGRTMGVGGSF